MALSADAPRNYSVTGIENGLPMQASVTAYAGGALSIDSDGEVGPLAGSEVFVGFCRKQAVNGATAGGTNVDVVVQGEVELTITGMGDNDDIGDIVYATDDNTFTLTASGASAIGRVSQIVNLTDNKARVRFTGLTARDQV